MGKIVIFFGFNNPCIYKRGVENVISTQAASIPEVKKYYIFFDSSSSVFKWNDIVCLSIKKNGLRFLKLNIFILYFFLKNKGNRILIHSHNYLFSFFLLIKTDIFTVHDGLFYLNAQLTKNKYLLMSYSLIERLTYLRSKHIQFVSHYALAQALLDKTNNQKLSVIENTTPLESFKVDLPIRSQKGEDKIIFSVRSIEERANLELLIAVAELYREREMKLRFFIAGKGPLLSHYSKVIIEKKLSNIVFLGFVSDEELICWYRKCDIVLITSKYGEGFGLPIIEGYFFNKPVLASNVCAIPEVIISKEYLFENNVQDLISRLDWLIKKVEMETLLNFEDYYKTNFSMGMIGARYRQLYTKQFA